MRVWLAAGRHALGSRSLRLPTRKHGIHIISSSSSCRSLMEHFLIPVQAARACWPAALATRMAVQHVRNTALLASAASRQPVQRGSMAAAARLVGLEHRVVHHAGGRARGQQVLERVAAVVRLARPQVDRPGPSRPSDRWLTASVAAASSPPAPPQRTAVPNRSSACQEVWCAGAADVFQAHLRDARRSRNPNPYPNRGN